MYPKRKKYAEAVAAHIAAWNGVMPHTWDIGEVADQCTKQFGELVPPIFQYAESTNEVSRRRLQIGEQVF